MYDQSLYWPSQQPYGHVIVISVLGNYWQFAIILTAVSCNHVIVIGNLQSSFWQAKSMGKLAVAYNDHVTLRLMSTRSSLNNNHWNCCNCHCTLVQSCDSCSTTTPLSSRVASPNYHCKSTTCIGNILGFFSIQGLGGKEEKKQV